LYESIIGQRRFGPAVIYAYATKNHCAIGIYASHSVGSIEQHGAVIARRSPRWQIVPLELKDLTAGSLLLHLHLLLPDITMVCDLEDGAMLDAYFDGFMLLPRKSLGKQLEGD
jgi:hypothetical protein